MSYVSAIQPGNKALEFIDRRLLDDNYRGTESSEHNRYDMEEIFNTLTILDKYAPNRSLMRIRDTDLSKRPINTPEEINYAHFCSEVKIKVGKGTQDSIRKNIFVDIHRMGLIDRYGADKIKMNAYEGGSVKYVSLSADGIKFIKSNLMDRAFMFTKALDKLLGGYIEISLDILKDDDYKIDRITKWEFMFFVSAIDVPYPYRLNIEQCIEMIREFRALAPIQRKSVIEVLKTELNPKKFAGDKTKKRDWHNWQNKIDQVYHLFKQSPYFDVSGRFSQDLTLSTMKIRNKRGELVDIKKRSLSEKNAYLENHHIKKTSGYELHHVVPLAWAESFEQYKLFDKWTNMVYIDAYSHAKITQNSNRNIYMDAIGDNIELTDGTGGRVYLVNSRNILYDVAKKEMMLDYNRQLRTTV